jgi:hypothetical protein
MSNINVQLEKELLDNPDKLTWMYNLLSQHQFSEDL